MLKELPLLKTRQLLFRQFLPVVLAFASCGENTAVDSAEHGIESDKAVHPQTVIPKLPKVNAPSNSNISSAIQDRNGIIWFATSGAGIFRFDGKAFVNYTEADGLCNNYVWCVFEASNGTIWFGTSDGICTYDGIKFSPMPVNIPGDTTILPNNKPGHSFSVDQYGFAQMEDAVWDITEDRNGKLWFGTAKGVFTYNGTNFEHFTVTDDVVNNSNIGLKNIEHLLEDKDGNMWFGGRLMDGAVRYDGKDLSAWEVDGNMWVWPLLQDRAGNIWFSNWGGAICFDGNTFVNYRSKDTTLKDVTNMLEDRAGNLWFTCDGKANGICRYSGNSFDHFTSDTTASFKGVWAILEDNSGNIWFGTRNIGLYKYDGKAFTAYAE